MSNLPRLNQAFDYYSITPSAEGDEDWLIETNSIACRLNEGSKIVKDSRGEDKDVDAVMHTNYDVLLVKGNGILYNQVYYKIDDVRVTRDLQGNPFMQFVTLLKTENVNF